MELTNTPHFPELHFPQLYIVSRAMVLSDGEPYHQVAARNAALTRGGYGNPDGAAMDGLAQDNELFRVHNFLAMFGNHNIVYGRLVPPGGQGVDALLFLGVLYDAPEQFAGDGAAHVDPLHPDIVKQQVEAMIAEGTATFAFLRIGELGRQPLLPLVEDPANLLTTELLASVPKPQVAMHGGEVTGSYIVPLSLPPTASRHGETKVGGLHIGEPVSTELFGIVHTYEGEGAERRGVLRVVDLMADGDSTVDAQLHGGPAVAMRVFSGVEALAMQHYTETLENNLVEVVEGTANVLLHTKPHDVWRAIMRQQPFPANLLSTWPDSAERN